MGPVLALLTALYEDDVTAVACSGGLVSFLSVLEHRFCQVPQDVIVPGMLEVTDLGEIAASIAPRAVFLQRMVDGLNKRVPVSAVEKEYGTAPSVMIGEKSENLSIGEWLSQALVKK